MAPDHIVDYLIVHELSHIIEPNHSKNFWYHVGNYCEDFKKKENGCGKMGISLFCSPHVVRNIEPTLSKVL